MGDFAGFVFEGMDVPLIHEFAAVFAIVDRLTEERVPFLKRVFQFIEHGAVGFRTLKNARRFPDHIFT